MRTDFCRWCVVVRRSKSPCVVYLLVLCTVLASVLLFTKTTTKVSAAWRFRHFATSASLLRHRLAADDDNDVVAPTSSDVIPGATGRTQQQQQQQRGPRRCDEVFPGMLHGRWVPKRNVSEARRREMDELLQKMRGELRIPGGLQRADGRCGNLSFQASPHYPHMALRALCDPRGPTPCCFRFRCSDRSPDQCRCPSCLDPRTPEHAELSDWRPARAECRPREFGAREACRLLSGVTVVLAGDSFVRHVFVALMMLLTDDFEEGALRKTASLGIRRYCRGMMQINGLRCRDILDENRKALCNGTVHAVYREIFSVSKGDFLLPYLQGLQGAASPRRAGRVLLLVGLGIHDQFRADVVWPRFLQPLVENVTGISIPSAANLSIPFIARFQEDPFLAQPQPVIPEVPNFYPERSESSGSPADSHGGGGGGVGGGGVVGGGGRQKWPKMIWINTHAPGLLKSPLFPSQSFQGVQFYNEVISRLLEPYGIPVLDTFNMTAAPLHAVDGTHYGYAVNHLKAQLLLNWVQERQDRGAW